jgi:hypothetical protein
MNIGEILDKKRIDNKREYYFLYGINFFGNKPLTWDSIEEITKDGWRGGICIRGLKGIPRSMARFDLNLEEAINYVKKLEKEGIPKEKLTFNQSMPNGHLLIQGEVMRSPNYYELTYTTIKEPMNYGLAKETLYEDGIKALNKLKQNLFPSSYENMQELFDLFPDSIIEFSSYNIPVGNLRNRNTIFWEVRNY